MPVPHSAGLRCPLKPVQVSSGISAIIARRVRGALASCGFDLRYEDERGESLFVVRFMPPGTKEVLDKQGKLERTLARGERVQAAAANVFASPQFLPSKPSEASFTLPSSG